MKNSVFATMATKEVYNYLLNINADFAARFKSVFGHYEDIQVGTVQCFFDRVFGPWAADAEYRQMEVYVSTCIHI